MGFSPDRLRRTPASPKPAEPAVAPQANPSTEAKPAFTAEEAAFFRQGDMRSQAVEEEMAQRAAFDQREARIKALEAEKAKKAA